MGYESKTVVQLKALLRKRGLPISGNKAALVQRLEDYDNSETSSSSEVVAKKKKKKVKPPTSSSSSEESSEVVPKKSGGGGKMPLDENFPIGGGEVFEDYGCMLNQTNIRDNNNKFYKIQLVIVGSSYYLYVRYGRVGEKGRGQNKGPFNKTTGINNFKKQFKTKTGNDWENRANFVPKNKKYELIELDHEDDDLEEMNQALETLSSTKVSRTVRPCQLSGPLKNLIKLVFDHDMFKEQMKTFDLDVKKLPLGKLSKKQVEIGFEILEDIENVINGGRGNLERLCSKFYTHVPHSFGRRVPPILRDPESVQKKKDMLNVLSDIVVAQNLVKEKVELSEGEVTEVDHPLDAKYKAINCDLEWVPQDTEEFQKIATYLENTMGQFDLELEDLFTVRRHGEEERFAEFDDVENRKLLWHGTNVAVVAAILSSGLRIMPHSGGRVGKGIYFASENSKSACYVRCAGQTGIMFLGEVALGKEHIITRDDSSLKKAPSGYDSILAKGWTEPDPEEDSTLEIDGKEVIIPQGKPIKIPEYAKSSFTQSEYLVYKESQNRLRYLLKLKFKGRSGWY